MIPRWLGTVARGACYHLTLDGCETDLHAIEHVGNDVSNGHPLQLRAQRTGLQP
jgi:hypothetical protein